IRSVRREKRHDLRDLLRLCGASHGSALAMLREKAGTVFHHIVQKIGHRVSYADRIDADPVLSEFECQGACELRQCTLRCAVGGNRREGEVRRVRGDIDDGPFFFGIITFAASRECRNAPVTFVAITHSQSLRVMSTNGLYTMRAALLTSTSSVPKRSTAR